MGLVMVHWTELTETKDGNPEEEEAMNPTLIGPEPEARACQEDEAVPVTTPLVRVALARFHDPVNVA